MIVLHFSTGKQWRGGEQQILYTLHYLSADVNSYLVCQPETELSKKAAPVCTKVFPLKVRNSVDVRAIFAFIKVIRNIKPDIIHFHDSKSHTIGLLALTLSSIKLPCVLSRRVLFHMKSNASNRWKYNHPRIKRIITVSDAIREKVLSIPVLKEKVQTVYSGTDTRVVSSDTKSEARNMLCSRFDLDPNQYLIGNVSALTEEKDLETYIKAAKKVVNENSKVVFLSFGKGPLKMQLEKLITQNGLEQVVKLTGFHLDIHDLIPGLDLLVSTSKSEGLGTNLLDGIKALVPLIATNVGGIPEIIEDKENGLLFESGDYNELGELILTLISDPSLVSKFVKNAKETLSKFDAKNNVGKIESIYQEIVQV